jgi:hypothetical protein
MSCWLAEKTLRLTVRNALKFIWIRLPDQGLWEVSAMKKPVSIYALMLAWTVALCATLILISFARA